MTATAVLCGTREENRRTLTRTPYPPADRNLYIFAPPRFEFSCLIA